MHFPRLFKTSKLGKELVWTTWTDGSSFFKQGYFTSGKVKDPVEKKCKITNAGKKNELSAIEQAEVEAARAWVMSIDKGYKPASDDENGMAVYDLICKQKELGGNTNRALPMTIVEFIKTGKVKETEINSSGSRVVKTSLGSKKEKASNDLITIKPMLAFPYEDKKAHFDPVKEEWVSQYKLDGIRCLARVVGDTVSLTTRTGKEIKFLEYIKSELFNLLTEHKRYSTFPIILDGELYARQLINDKGNVISSSKKFDIISGACRPIRTKPSEYESQIFYHVFDVIVMTKSAKPTIKKTIQRDRLEEMVELEKLVNNYTFKMIEFERAEIVRCVEQLDTLHSEAVSKGYEGIVLRKVSGLYEERRTTSLLKYKKFQDAEFKIIGVTEGTGTEKDCAVWICATKDGNEFNVRPKGSFDDRKVMLKNRLEYMGKLLTVEFQELGENGVPRFPVGKTIRDYE